MVTGITSTLLGKIMKGEKLSCEVELEAWWYQNYGTLDRMVDWYNNKR